MSEKEMLCLSPIDTIRRLTAVFNSNVTERQMYLINLICRATGDLEAREYCNEYLGKVAISIDWSKT